MKWSNLPNKYAIRSSFIVVPDRAFVLTANQKLCRNNYISERKKIPTDGLQTLLFAGPPRCFAIAGSSDRLRSICSAAHARLRPRWPSIGPSYYGNISQSLLETTPENVGSFHVLETIGGEKHSSSTMSTPATVTKFAAASPCRRTPTLQRPWTTATNP
jgi:hypothetical protein